MNFDQYMEAAAKTAIYPREELEGVLYTSLGLVSEAGEVAGKVKKMLRDDKGKVTFERAEAIHAEIGDVLWYCAMLAHELGFSLQDIAEGNIKKLADRMSRNAIKGSGDNR